MRNKSGKRIRFCIAVMVVLLIGSNAFATCLQDNMGNTWCPKYPNGGIIKNAMGDVVCGKGDCRGDGMGNIKCSKAKSGGAGVDAMGNVVCVGGCEPASKEACVQAEK